MSRYMITCGTKKYGLKAWIIIAIITILIIFELLGGRSYFDEILGLCSMIYVILLYMKNKLDRTDKISVILLILTIIIGFLSNIYSKINLSITSIMIDAVVETKFLWVLFAIKYYVTSKEIKDVNRILKPLAKVFCILAGICAIVSQVINIGMTGTERYGIKGFKFFFPMSFQFLAVSMICIAVLSIKNDKKIFDIIFQYVLR